jgi:uncharacterized protein
VLNGDRSFAISELVLSGFVRVATNPRIFEYPTPIQGALGFTEVIRTSGNCVIVRPGGRHWSIFNDLCQRAEARGNLVADAYHAALAIESGCEWITTDRDYSRFPGLLWRHPLDS